VCCDNSVTTVCGKTENMNAVRIFSLLVSAGRHVLCSPLYGDSVVPQVSITPYTFTLDPDTHQLATSWEVSGDMSVTSVCAYGSVTMYEMSWIGEPKEMSSGNSWAVYCRESEKDRGKMEVDVDVTKFRVEPFKSYKVCVSLDDYAMDWAAEPACTHLFSFEKYVPYIPDTEEKSETGSDHSELVNSEKQSELERDEKKIENKQKVEKEAEAIESVLKHQLSNIENFVRDDYKAKYLELKDEIIEEVEDKILHSSASDRRQAATIGLLILLSAVRTIMQHL